MPLYIVTNQETGESYQLNESDLQTGPKDGDVSVISSTDTVLEFMSGKTPYHIKALMIKAESLNMTPEESEYELDCFVGGPTVSFSDYVNTEVSVIGAAIIPHGPYKAYSDRNDPNAQLQPGYLRCLFVIDELDKDGNNVILECNGSNVFSHAVNMLNVYGWYLWDTPRKYIIKRGGSKNAYYMRSTHRPSPRKTVVSESK